MRGNTVSSDPLRRRSAGWWGFGLAQFLAMGATGERYESPRQSGLDSENGNAGFFRQNAVGTAPGRGFCARGVGGQPRISVNKLAPRVSVRLISAPGHVLHMAHQTW